MWKLLSSLPQFQLYAAHPTPALARISHLFAKYMEYFSHASVCAQRRIWSGGCMSL